MIEVNVRIFFPKKGNALFPDYHKFIEMVQEELQGKIKTFLDAVDPMPIYQYYSVSVLGYIESRYLRRMHLGKSVMCITEGIQEYAKSRHMPRMMKQIIYRYLQMYLNSLDYIVVPDNKVKTELKREGVDRPEFYEIPMEDTIQKSQCAHLWMDLYQKIQAA